MATPSIVDELVVLLRLNAEEYERAEAKVEQQTDRTFRKQQERARRTDRTNRDQQKRIKDVAAGVRSFARQVTAATAVVTGLGVAVGGILTGFLGFETNLRRQAVGTALSNRQMQAWSATARRMGADAHAGAEAIAALAKERQQFELTGQAPTMQALARMGVNVDKGRSLEDILADAQRIYRGAPAGQRQQFENTLAAQGVSADLILMIKSEIDARDAYTRSYGQAVEENREALDRFADMLESVKAQGLGVASALLEALSPAIEWSAEKLGDLATQVVQFANDLRDAGGSADAFQQALDKNFPKLGHLYEGFGLLGDAVVGLKDILLNAAEWIARKLGTGLELLNRVRNPFGTEGVVDSVRNWWNGGDPEGPTRMQRAALAVDGWLRGAAARPDTRGAGGQPWNLENGPAPGTPQPRNLENDIRPGDANGLMAVLTGQYGLSVAQAAAVVANLQRESGLNPAAVNPAGGGTGARGLAQWRGARSQAFKARYGVMPDQGTVAQQIEFMMTDPYERGLLNRALASGTAADMGRRFSAVYEAHGDVAEDARRGAMAAQLAGRAGGTSVHINQMNVQTPNAQEFASGMQRIDTTQPYNTVVRM